MFENMLWPSNAIYSPEINCGKLYCKGSAEIFCHKSLDTDQKVDMIGAKESADELLQDVPED